MPNLCQNKLKLGHEKEEMILRAIDAFNKKKLISEFFPEPDYNAVKVLSAFPAISGSEYVKNSEAWWHWRIRNWGTKWDVGANEGEDLSISKGYNFVCMEFYSAWAPPIGAMQKMEEYGFKVELYYWERGVMFCGKYLTGRGNEYYNYDSIQSVKENIPLDINNKFDIIQKLELKR